MPRHKEKPAKQLDFFDFDQTVSIRHTFKHQHDETFDHHHNIKSGLPLVHHDGKTIAAIVSYHNNPELIMTYLETHLNQSMKKIKQMTTEHEVLSIYEVNGQKTPLLISTLPDDDHYDAHLAYHQAHGKNKQLKTVYDYLKKHHCIHRKTSFHYYDDTAKNIDMVTQSFKCFKLTPHLVNKDKVEFELLASENKPGHRYSFFAEEANEGEKKSGCCRFFRLCC